MYRFLETIKLLDGNFSRLSFHQQRLKEAYAECYPTQQVPDLYSLLQNSDFPLKGLFKCRILFSNADYKIEFEPYNRKEIKTLQLVDTNIPTCKYKTAVRSAFQNAFNQRGTCDDVLLVRDGFITDTSYANVAFFDGENWITPEVPLIYGVNRASLMAERNLIEAPVKKTDLLNFQFIRLFNAMIDFGEIELSITAIKRSDV